MDSSTTAGVAPISGLSVFVYLVLTVIVLSLRLLKWSYISGWNTSCVAADHVITSVQGFYWTWPFGFLGTCMAFLVLSLLFMFMMFSSSLPGVYSWGGFLCLLLDLVADAIFVLVSIALHG